MLAFTGILVKIRPGINGWANVSLLFKYYYLSFIGIWSMALGGLLLAGWFPCIIDWPFYVPTEFFLFLFLLFFPVKAV